MQYNKDREVLNMILLTCEDIKIYRDEILRIIPELIICVECTQKNKAHIYNVYEHIEETVNRVEKSLLLKMVALLHDIGKPYKKYIKNDVERFWGHEEVSELLSKLILKRLGYDKEFINNVCKLIKYHDRKTEKTEESIKETISIVGESLVEDLIKIQTADILSHSPRYADLLYQRLQDVKEVYDLYISKINTN